MCQFFICKGCPMSPRSHLRIRKYEGQGRTQPANLPAPLARIDGGRRRASVIKVVGISCPSHNLMQWKEEKGGPDQAIFPIPNPKVW
jgi:hypothetical protein